MQLQRQNTKMVLTTNGCFQNMHIFLAQLVTTHHNLKTLCECHMSNEKNPGWLGYIGDYTTQLYRDYNTPL